MIDIRHLHFVAPRTSPTRLVCSLSAVTMIASWSVVLGANWPWRWLELAAASTAAICVVVWLCIRADTSKLRWLPYLAVASMLVALVTHAAIGYWQVKLQNLPTLEHAFLAPEMGVQPAAGRHTAAQSIDGGQSMQILRARDRGSYPIPRLWFPRGLEDQQSELADQLLQGRLTLLGESIFDLPAHPTWSEDPFSNRSWQLEFHSFNYLHPLISKYKKTKNILYLKKAETILLSWIEANSAWWRNAPSEFSWNDHAVAIRTSVMTDFFRYWIKSDLATSEKADLLLRSLLAHGRYLAHPSRYTQKHNHGIDQDIALIVLSKVIPEFREADKWLDLSVTRLRAQLRETVSPNGVHREHSPSYHISTLRHLTELRDFAILTGVNDFSTDDYQELLGRMAQYIPFVVKPDGFVVPVGDSSESEMIRSHESLLLPYAANDEALDYALSAGARGRPGPQFKVYKDEGLAFVRLQGTQMRESLYLAFIAASNVGLVHKHMDDLSFTLYGCGRNLVIDHGLYGYKYDLWREYFVGSRAHNSITVNGGLDNQFGRPAMGGTRLTTAFEGSNFFIVQGVAAPNEDVEHTRTMILFAPDIVFVFDQLRQSSKAASRRKVFEFESNIHLASDLDLQKTEFSDAFRVMDGTYTIATIQVSGSESIRNTSMRGQDSPKLGWTVEKRHHVKPSPTLNVTWNAQQADLLHKIHLAPNCSERMGKAGENIRSEVSASVSINQLQLNWSQGAIRRQIVVGNMGRIGVTPEGQTP